MDFKLPKTDANRLFILGDRTASGVAQTEVVEMKRSEIDVIVGENALVPGQIEYTGHQFDVVGCLFNLASAVNTALRGELLVETDFRDLSEAACVVAEARHIRGDRAVNHAARGRPVSR